MKKELAYFSLVVLLSVAVAHVCHTFFPGVAPAVKPLTWPLFYVLARALVYVRR